MREREKDQTRAMRGREKDKWKREAGMEQQGQNERINIQKSETKMKEKNFPIIWRLVRSET